MRIEYSNITCTCGNRFDCRATDPYWLICEALIAGWAIDGSSMWCPECVKDEDGIRDRMLVGITPEMLERLVQALKDCLPYIERVGGASKCAGEFGAFEKAVEIRKLLVEIEKGE